MADVNDELKQKLLEALNAVGTEISQGYSASKELVVQQAPEIIQEIVRWGIVRNAAMVIGCLAVIVPWSLYLNWARKKKDRKNEYGNPNERNWDDFGIGMVSVCGTAFIATVTLPGLWFSVSNFLQALVAPRLFLIHQAADLLK